MSATTREAGSVYVSCSKDQTTNLSSCSWSLINFAFSMSIQNCHWLSSLSPVIESFNSSTHLFLSSGYNLGLTGSGPNFSGSSSLSSAESKNSTFPRPCSSVPKPLAPASPAPMSPSTEPSVPTSPPPASPTSNLLWSLMQNAGIFIYLFIPEYTMV